MHTCLENTKSLLGQTQVHYNDLMSLNYFCYQINGNQLKVDEEIIKRDSYGFRRKENVVLLYMVVLITFLAFFSGNATSRILQIGEILFLFLFVNLGLSTAQAAGPTYSANRYLPGCEGIVRNQPTLDSARCIGVLEGLAILGQVNNLWCAPDTTTTEQWVRVVVKFIEDRPARMHEDFRLLAIEALKQTWPCRQ
jgi:hypothetical protein